MDSYEDKPIRHQPLYDNPEEMSEVLEKLIKVPAIVEVDRIHDLKNQLKECGLGDRMMIQLGDCSESFKD